MTKRATWALALGLGLGLLTAVSSTRWPMGDATGIVLLSAGSGLIAAVLIGAVVDVVLHRQRFSRSAAEGTPPE